MKINFDTEKQIEKSGSSSERTFQKMEDIETPTASRTFFVSQKHGLFELNQQDGKIIDALMNFQKVCREKILFGFDLGNYTFYPEEHKLQDLSQIIEKHRAFDKSTFDLKWYAYDVWYNEHGDLNEYAALPCKKAIQSLKESLDYLNDQIVGVLNGDLQNIDFAAFRRRVDDINSSQITKLNESINEFVPDMIGPLKKSLNDVNEQLLNVANGDFDKVDFKILRRKAERINDSRIVQESFNCTTMGGSRITSTIWDEFYQALLAVTVEKVSLDIVNQIQQRDRVKNSIFAFLRENHDLIPGLVALGDLTVLCKDDDRRNCADTEAQRSLIASYYKVSQMMVNDGSFSLQEAKKELENMNTIVNRAFVIREIESSWKRWDQSYPVVLREMEEALGVSRSLSLD